MSEKLIKLETITVRTGNSMLPLLIKSNLLGLRGYQVLEMNIVSGGIDFGDEMTVELYGRKTEETP